MPRADELLRSVTDFLREQVMTQTTGRTQFLARVAGNSLDIVLRENGLGRSGGGSGARTVAVFVVEPRD